MLEILHCRSPSHVNRHHLVTRSVQDQDRDIQTLEVLFKIRLRQRLDAVVDVLEAGHHALLPPGPDLPVGHFGGVAVVIEKGSAGDVDEELRAVFDQGRAIEVEGLDRHAIGVGVGLDHLRRDCANQDCLANALGAVPAHIMGNLAAARGVPDDHGVFEIEMLEQLVQGRRRRCPCRCRTRAGTSGRGHDGRARCSGSRGWRGRTSGSPSCRC